ncbi:MAG: hypothetical protein COB65_13945 [Thalassobium sp.]|nr:MAG: hypothetical protein COB65_13945 [Thalassobium sp.]
MLPVGTFKMKALITDVQKKKPTMQLKDGIFFKDLDNIGIRAKEKDPITDEITDLLIYDYTVQAERSKNREYIEDKRKYGRTIRAQKGMMSTDPVMGDIILSMENGQITEELSPSDFEGSTYPFRRITFDKSTMHFSMQSLDFERTDEDLYQKNYEFMSISQLMYTRDSIDSDIEFEQLAVFNHLNLSTATIPELSVDYVGDATVFNRIDKTERKRAVSHALMRASSYKDFIDRKIVSKESKQSYQNNIDIEWHRKFTLAFACIVLFFVGAPMGAIVKKGGLGMPVVITVGFFLIYYICTMMGERMARGGVISPFMGMWMSSLILFPTALILTYKANQDSSIFDSNFYKRLFRLKKKNAGTPNL